MLDLAIHYGEGQIPLKDVAERQQISEKYLWNLIGPLKTAHLIKSVRGSSGGFSIARRPEEINLKDIVSVLEGSLCLVDCVDDPDVCERADNCVTREIWGEISASIQEKLCSLTLRDMVEKRLKRNTKVKLAADSIN